jgi:hypothetical protein
MRWNSGYRADGTFVELDPPNRAAIRWRGTGEPGETTLEWTVQPAGAGVTVTVAHGGFGAGGEWDEAVAQSEKGWSLGLENLKSTLETGIDQRIARQPFLGINLDRLTPERAAKEGIAADEGIYVLDTVEGSGARAAGLGKGDAIVGMAGMETPGFAELGAALRACQAGDVVDVDLVRGQNRETVQVTLGSRPMRGLPASTAEVADELVQGQAAANAELKAVLKGVSEAEAEQQPAEGEWSVKQTLAHLSDGERGFHMVLVSIAVNGWFDAQGVYPDQIPGRLGAVLAVTPTLEGLVERFVTDQAETVALVRGLPETTIAHKARFRRLAEFALFGPDHTREHIAQIKGAIEGVRSR